MRGKLSTVMAKKEAETYRTQGLHQEAIDIYAKLLMGSPNLHPELKKAIQSRINGLSGEMTAFASQRERSFTAQDIIRIKNGWGQKASEADHLVCAQALLRIGAFTDALEEFGGLLKKGSRPRQLVNGVNDCLVGLYSPEAFTAGLNRFIKTFFADEKSGLVFRLLLGKDLERRSINAYLVRLCEDLLQRPALSAAVAARIRDILSQIEQQSGLAAPAIQRRATTPETAAQPKKSGIVGRIKACFTK